MVVEFLVDLAFLERGGFLWLALVCTIMWNLGFFFWRGGDN